MWRASILDRNDPPNPETTGSSGILTGLAWGVNSGILDRQKYQPVVEKAWEGLTQIAVQKSGLLGYCQPVGGSPNPVILFYFFPFYSTYFIREHPFLPTPLLHSPTLECRELKHTACCHQEGSLTLT